MTDNFGWPWIFFLNVPLGLISLVVCWRLLPPIKHPESGRNIDYLGAGLFTAALVPILLGLSNKRSLDWTDPWVGGLILLGLAIAAVFIWWESRAADPIIRLQLFRNRTVTISIASMFLAAFGFFGAIVFLPQWFQVVRGMGATQSGLNLLPLVFALILGATVSGQVAARTGRYKVIILGSMVILAVGLFLLTNLRADTELPILWLWMVVAGIGVGPSFALFAALVQNNVEPQQIGSATASLTFFQQIGGTIGLTIAGTLLADSLTKELPGRLVANGISSPPEAGAVRRSTSRARATSAQRSSRTCRRRSGPSSSRSSRISSRRSTRASPSPSHRPSGSASERRFSLP